MPRKPDLNKKNRYYDPFPSRLRALMERHGTSQEEIKTVLDLKNRQSVTGYVDGSTVPTSEKIVAIAKYYDVTTDYLLGLSPTEKAEYSFFSEQSGFSNETVSNLILMSAKGNPSLPAARQRASFEFLMNSGVLFTIVEKLQNYLDIKACENKTAEIQFDISYFLQMDKTVAENSAGQLHVIASGLYASTFQTMASSDLAFAFEKIADSVGEKWHSYMPHSKSPEERKQEVEERQRWLLKNKRLEEQKQEEWKKRIGRNGIQKEWERWIEKDGKL